MFGDVFVHPRLAEAMLLAAGIERARRGALPAHCAGPNGAHGKLRPMSALSSTERRAMRANAHHLDPVVFIGQHGLTPAVQHEIDVALRAHELVKIRVHNESRVERQAMLAAICAALACAPASSRLSPCPRGRATR